MKATLRFVLDIDTEQQLTNLHDDTVTFLTVNDVAVLSHDQAIAEDLYTVLYIPEDTKDRSGRRAHTERVYAADADAAKDQVDAPDRLVIGATRGQLELE